jgi:hypothetical protein
MYDSGKGVGEIAHEVERSIDTIERILGLEPSLPVKGPSPKKSSLKEVVEVVSDKPLHNVESFSAFISTGQFLCRLPKPENMTEQSLAELLEDIRAHYTPDEEDTIWKENKKAILDKYSNLPAVRLH